MRPQQPDLRVTEWVLQPSLLALQSDRDAPVGGVDTAAIALQPLPPAFRMGLLVVVCVALTIGIILIVLLLRLRQTSAAATSGERGCCRGSVATVVAAFYLANIIIGNITPSVLIPPSFDLMTSLLTSGAEVEQLSGWLVSVYYIGAVAGALLALPVVSPPWDQRRVKAVVLICSAGICVAVFGRGVAAYSWAWAASAPHPARPSAQPKTGRIVLLFVSQVVAGLSQELPQTVLRLLLVRVASPSSQPTVGVLEATSLCVGFGLGPLLAAAVGKCLPRPAAASTITAYASFALGGIWLVWLVGFAWLVPGTNEQVEAVQESAAVQEEENAQRSGDRRRLALRSRLPINQLPTSDLSVARNLDAICQMPPSQPPQPPQPSQLSQPSPSSPPKASPPKAPPSSASATATEEWSGQAAPLDGTHGVDGDEEARQLEERRLTYARRATFWAYLLLATVRAWLVAGLEVTTSLVLETEFHVSLLDNGVAIGSCFLIASPLILVGLFAKHAAWLSPQHLMSATAALLAAFCLLIFHWPGMPPAVSLALLFTGDSLIYPAAYTVSGISQGLAIGYTAVPGSRLYTATSALVAGKVLICGVGKFIAPPLARAVVRMGGRSAYAGVQSGLALLTLVVCVASAGQVSLLLAQRGPASNGGKGESGIRAERE